MILFKRPAMRGLTAGAVITWNVKPDTEILEEWINKIWIIIKIINIILIYIYHDFNYEYKSFTSY